ncbi:hypothetical protein ABPG75_008317 [Micractinium tetrahymenae]
MAAVVSRLLEQPKGSRPQLAGSTANGQLAVAEAACRAARVVLLSPGKNCMEAASGIAAESRAQAVALYHSCLEALWLCLPVLAPAAAVLSAAATAASSPPPAHVPGTGSRLESALEAFCGMAHSAGFVVRLMPPAGILSTWRQERAELLAPGFEAPLRCCARLHQLSLSPPPAMLSDTLLSCYASLAHCLAWVEQSRPQLTAEAAERLLAGLASLASTVCKCALLQAPAAGAQQDAGARAVAPVPQQEVAQHLLTTLLRCSEVAAVISDRAARPSEHCKRLLVCVGLQHAEAAASLLPTAGAEIRRQWEPLTSLPIAPLALQQGEEGVDSLRALAA